MAEGHLDDDRLIALALGDLGREQEAALRHLGDCRVCRADYDALSHTIDAVVPASPAEAPPAGFDARVLERLEILRPEQRRSYRTTVLVAAVAVIGSILGAVGASLLGQDKVPTAGGTPLVTAAGKTVGGVDPGTDSGRDVVVLHVTDGSPGTHYTCRMRFDDGTVQNAGDWVMPESGRATWIVTGSSADIDRIELVTDDGKVWSTATPG